MSVCTSTITKPKKTAFQPTLKLQLKKQRKPRKTFLFSWTGLEDKKQEMQRLAHAVVEKHKLLEKACAVHGWDLPGLVLSYVRDNSSVSFCPYVSFSFIFSYHPYSQ